MRSRPLIGITGRRLPVSSVEGQAPVLRNTWFDAYVVDYAQAVAAAGGLPVFLSRVAAIDPLVEVLGGLVLAGGCDVHPERYGGGPVQAAGPGHYDPGLDEFELGLVRAAAAASLPLLGICRGCQVINVALGGSLVSDLPAAGHHVHHDPARDRAARSHRVSLVAGSVVAGMHGTEAWVNSFHHQAVDRCGERVRVVARADDGVVEAIEVVGVPMIGVQWHPEMLDTGPELGWIVDQARARAGSTRAVVQA